MPNAKDEDVKNLLVDRVGDPVGAGLDAPDVVLAFDLFSIRGKWTESQGVDAIGDLPLNLLRQIRHRLESLAVDIYMVCHRGLQTQFLLGLIPGHSIAPLEGLPGKLQIHAIFQSFQQFGVLTRYDGK